MSLSIVPYLLFLYLIYRVWRLDPKLIHKTTMLGFAAMIGFVIITATAGFIALKIMGARTLGNVDWLHGIAEGGLTLTNGLIALGLKKQLDEIELAELDEDEESSAPAMAGAAPGNAFPDME
jgi:hypothetical protein